MRYTLLFLTLMSTALFSQNLVENGGFETPACPQPGMIINDLCPPWDEITQMTCDHYGACTFVGSPTTTNNQNPYEGQSMAGLYVYGTFGNIYNREYLVGTLTQRLTAGQRYRFYMRVYPILSSAFGINAAINGPGVLFFNGTRPVLPADLLLQNPNALQPSTVVNNRNAWNTVCLSYTATGEETHFIIGNFQTDANSVVVSMDANPAELGYYLVDDVHVEEIEDESVLEDYAYLCPGGSVTFRVSEDKGGQWSTGENTPQITVYAPGIYVYTYPDGPCYRSDQIEVLPTNCKPCDIWLPTAFTPNGDNKNDVYLPQTDCGMATYHLEIFNRWGQLVYESVDLRKGWNGGGLPGGVYLARVEATYPYEGRIDRIYKYAYVTLIY